MFTISDEALPMSLMRNDPASGVARHFGLRPRDWQEMAYQRGPAHLAALAHSLAERFLEVPDLIFVKMEVWYSTEAPDGAAAFRARTGLSAKEILRRPVSADGAGTEDWAALFRFALDFGWDAAALSRHRRALVWFSHDEFLRATPASFVRGL